MKECIAVWESLVTSTRFEDSVSIILLFVGMAPFRRILEKKPPRDCLDEYRRQEERMPPEEFVLDLCRKVQRRERRVYPVMIDDATDGEAVVERLIAVLRSIGRKENETKEQKTKMERRGSAAGW